MLDYLRANARSSLTYFLFGIIIVVFIVSFGPGSCGGRSGQMPSSAARGEEVARVNGESIDAAEWEQQYGALFRAYQQQGGEAFTRELADRMGLRRIAADQLVERVLLRQEAARQGIVVGDDDLSRAVKENPAFQSGGHFDYEYYQRAVTNAYGSTSRFEERLREDLAVQKMVTLLRQTTKVSDDEVKEAWLADADKVNVEFVRFPLAAVKAEANVTPAEAEAFAKANPDQVKAKYEASKARWDKPKRVRARHILAKVDEGATPAQQSAAQKKAEDALARVKKGEDFAKVAKELSDDRGSADRGGDVGEFGPGAMAKPFEDAAFAAKKGEIVGPVRTNFGFHVIEVTDVHEAQSIPLEQVKNEVAREILQEQRATAIAKKKAEDALAQAKAGKPLANAEETGFFGASSPLVPRIGLATDLQKAALAGNAGQVLGVFDTASGPIVARVKSRERPDPAQFEQRKAEMAERIRARREAQVEEAFVKALREKAKVTVNEKIAGPAGGVLGG